MKKRLDIILVERGHFETREKAKREIMVGNVIVNERAETKAGTNFTDDDKLIIRIKENEKLKYVSRGGLKLEKAIEYWDLNFENKKVLDIGASTGGFTDCSLQNGASLVYAVDVGTNQLEWKLRQNEKVVSLENTHIKNLTKEDINNDIIDIVTIDVSFISLTKVIPYVKQFLSKNAIMVVLIKPQFELTREKIGKRGIVMKEEYHDEAVKKIVSFVKDQEYKIKGIIDSPIKGSKGNREFLMCLEY